MLGNKNVSERFTLWEYKVKALLKIIYSRLKKLTMEIYYLLRNVIDY